LRSYKELPIRWAELGTVYRYERSGVLHGLLRVRGFTQDDAHIFCTFDQLEEEILRTINFNRKILKAFGFEDYEVFLSTRPEEFVGTPEAWDKAEKALASALERAGMEYKIDPGEGVFYGPKIDVKIKDVLGRSWQCSTIQVDFNLPERFKLTYIGEDGRPHVPVMIHRALLGSLERFLGVLIEHYAGAFPLWLAPVQMVVIPIADRHFEYARKIEQKLKEEGFRAEGDYRSEKLGYKIREAQLKKIPYMIIIGDKEVESGKISLRIRGIGDEGAVELKEFVKRAKALVESKSINLK
jgi:threonyl-tRNA synthetase